MKIFNPPSPPLSKVGTTRNRGGLGDLESYFPGNSNFENQDTLIVWIIWILNIRTCFVFRPVLTGQGFRASDFICITRTSTYLNLPQGFDDRFWPDNFSIRLTERDHIAGAVFFHFTCHLSLIHFWHQHLLCPFS